MELTLSHNSILNTDLSASDGRPLYSISTPKKWTRRTTTITRYSLDEDGHATEASTELARIHWHYFGSSRLVYDGKIVDLDKFLPYEGLLRRYALEHHFRTVDTHGTC